MISKMAERRYAAEGSPADGVLAALHDVMKDARPDLVLSGVNRGKNAAENAVYSGTVGDAMEAALQGVPAVALSQYYGPANRDLDDTFECARAHGLSTLQRLLDRGARWSAPAAVFRAGWRFFRCYFLRFGFLDGYAGFYIACFQGFSTLFRYTRLYEHISRQSDPPAGTQKGASINLP